LQHTSNQIRTDQFFGDLFVQTEPSQTGKVQYNDYGKPVDTTRGKFTVKQAVNLRARADSSSAVVAVLPAGKIVTVNRTVHGYYEISYDGKIGYSWHKFFSPN
jgi:uncharacterized protein YgiM (DUF1202 family)